MLTFYFILLNVVGIALWVSVLVWLVRRHSTGLPLGVVAYIFASMFLGIIFLTPNMDVLAKYDYLVNYCSSEQVTSHANVVDKVRWRLSENKYDTMEEVTNMFDSFEHSDRRLEMCYDAYEFLTLSPEKNYRWDWLDAYGRLAIKAWVDSDKIMDEYTVQAYHSRYYSERLYESEELSDSYPFGKATIRVIKKVDKSKSVE